MKSSISVSSLIPHHPCVEDFWLVCSIPISAGFLKVVCMEQSAAAAEYMNGCHDHVSMSVELFAPPKFDGQVLFPSQSSEIL